jgi:gamma-glutamyltranspeptidase/glutathione hydrolase
MPVARHAVAGRAMVTTSQPLAAQAGLAALQRGGNAVDAALAAAITLTVVEPVSNGVGGDLFALVGLPDADAPVLALNASGRAPRAWTPQRFADRATMPMIGWDAVTVPGAPLGWRRLSERAGRLPFQALFDDAIRLADEGFAVTPVVAAKWAREGQRLGAVPGFAEHFLPGGRAPAVGEVFRTPHLGDTLREIAATGSESLYRGPLAHALASAAQAAGGAMTTDDLAAAWADDGWVQPLHGDYRGHRVHQLPPNGQGITTLIALGILQHVDSALLGSGSAPAQHRAIEALKLAFVDTYRGLADPQAMTERVDDWLRPERLAALARRIDPARASDFGAAVPPWGGTVYVAAADADGLMVSLIQSNFVGFGSGVVVAGTGISLHNRGAGFTLQPGHPNQVRGGKRPLHTIIPALVTKGGRPWGVLGVTGGPIQPQGQVQLLLQMIDGGVDAQAAVAAPRWKIEHKTAGLQLDLEPGYPAAHAAALRGLGHAAGPPGITGGDYGGAFAIVRGPVDADGAVRAVGAPRWVGAADPRRDGRVAATPP